MAVADPLAVAGRLRRRLKRRERAFGAWLSIGHPEIASIFAGARGDFVGVDLEHTTTELSTGQQIIRTCHEFGRACLPRIAPGNLEQLRRLLDAGADGVIVPQVSTRDDVNRVVEALRYPPEGRRGFGVAAAHQYGRVFDAYVRSANASLSLIVQVETIAAVERIEPIVAHPDVDGVMIGPYDLSGSLGVPGQLAHPHVRAAARRVIAACAAGSKSCGIHLVRPSLEVIRAHLADGFTFLVLGSDIFNLAQRSEEFDGMIAGCDADA
jgi:2-dehydro-3-deoxyglucarate aldolase